MIMKIEKIKWIIENHNGNLIFQGNEKFSMVDKRNAKKIMLSDGKNRYGFFVANGLFFINSTILDIKVDLNNYILEPIYTKTGLILINSYNHENKIHSCNIGYRLNGQEDSYEYLMSLVHNSEIHLTSKHFKKQELINEKYLRLQ